jgi:hypothetical protein
LRIRNAAAGLAAVGATALVTLAVVPASAATATQTKTVGSCTATGTHAACALTVQANRPVIMHARLTAAPDQVVKGQFTFSCSAGNHGTGELGTFDSRHPIRLKLRPGLAHPVSCSLGLQGHLRRSGQLQVAVTATFKG